MKFPSWFTPQNTQLGVMFIVILMAIFAFLAVSLKEHGLISLDLAPLAKPAAYFVWILTIPHVIAAYYILNPRTSATNED